jgi:hypothetical protein
VGGLVVAMTWGASEGEEETEKTCRRASQCILVSNLYENNPLVETLESRPIYTGY